MVDAVDQWRNRTVRILAGACLGAVLVAASAAPALAQAAPGGGVTDVAAVPLPGSAGAFLDNITGMLKTVAQKGVLMAVFLAAIAIAIGHFGEHGGALQKGRKWLGGAAAALVILNGFVALANAFG